MFVVFLITVIANPAMQTIFSSYARLAACRVPWSYHAGLLFGIHAVRFMHYRYRVMISQPSVLAVPARTCDPGTTASWGGAPLLICCSKCP